MLCGALLGELIMTWEPKPCDIFHDAHTNYTTARTVKATSLFTFLARNPFAGYHELTIVQ